MNTWAGINGPREDSAKEAIWKYEDREWHGREFYWTVIF
jgi:hypothetical protein